MSGRGDLRTARTAAASLAFVAVLAQAADPGSGNARLVSSTYLGGTRDDRAAAIATGPDGMLWIAGSSASSDWPGAERPDAPPPGTDAVVLRVHPSTREVLTAAYLGGSGFDTAVALAFDADGNGYVAGVTQSADFPGRDADGARRDEDAFVARLAPGGGGFDWTYVLGGGAGDEPRALCVLPGGDPVVVGSTDSPDFPSVGDAVGGPLLNRRTDAFVARVSAAGTGMAFCTRLGGRDDDHADAVAASASGTLVVAGRTLSPDFATSDPASHFAADTWTGFVTELDADGRSALRSRLYGPTRFTSLRAQADGSILCGGESSRPVLGIASFRHLSAAPFHDAVVLRLSAPDFDVAGGTYFGGSSLESECAIDVADDGTIWLAGTTYSPDLPVPDMPAGVPAQTADFFVASIDPADFRVLSGGMIGSPDRDASPSIAATVDGGAWLLGMTMSDEFPVLDPVASFATGLSGYDLVLAQYAGGASPLRPRTPRGLTVVAATPRTVELSWQPGDDLAASYAIDRANLQDFERVDTVPAGTTRWTDRFVLPDRGYTYTVQALNAGGGSPLSDDVRAVTPGSVAVDVTAGSMRTARRSPVGDLALAGTIRPAAPGDGALDLEGLGVTMTFFSELGNVDALSIPPGDPGWTRGRGAPSWRSGKRRFAWNPATGAFRLRAKGQPIFAGPGSSVTMQLVSGPDAGSATNTWHVASRSKLRTP